MDALVAGSRMKESTGDALVKNHALLVKRIAHHLLGKLPHRVQLDDLIQSGMLGLLEAARHYDANKGASFETYAGIRIKGHMLDEVRRNDWAPRSVYKNARMLSETVWHIENKLGRKAKDWEIAEALSIPLKEYHDIVQDSTSSSLYGFADLGVSDDVLSNEKNELFSEPHSYVLHQDLMKRLTKVLGTLPHKERLAMSLYYEHDLNLKEIGDILEVSESRISQILSQATSKIKIKLPH